MCILLEICAYVCHIIFHLGSIMYERYTICVLHEIDQTAGHILVAYKLDRPGNQDFEVSMFKRRSTSLVNILLSVCLNRFCPAFCR